jgi:hypothetical protein
LTSPFKGAIALFAYRLIHILYVFSHLRQRPLRSFKIFDSRFDGRCLGIGFASLALALASALALALAVATSRRLCFQNLSIIIGRNQARCTLHRLALSHTQYHPSIVLFNMP